MTTPCRAAQPKCYVAATGMVLLVALVHSASGQNPPLQVASTNGTTWKWMGNFCPSPQYGNNLQPSHYSSAPNWKNYMWHETTFNTTYPDLSIGSGGQMNGIINLAQCVSVCEFAQGSAAQFWSTFCVCFPSGWEGFDSVAAAALPENSSPSGGLYRRTQGGCPNVDAYALQIPTLAPTTSDPTVSPTVSPTESPSPESTLPPTGNPTRAPTTPIPTGVPTSSSPTSEPTTEPTQQPSSLPTKEPTRSPSSSAPTRSPTKVPSTSPTAQPSYSPTTSDPTSTPTIAPTSSPTISSPTATPTLFPTLGPTFTDPPTASPSDPPTVSPTRSPVTPEANTSDDGGGSSMIIIIAVVVVIVLIIIVAIIVCRRRNRKSSPDTTKGKKFQTTSTNRLGQQSPTSAKSNAFHMGSMESSTVDAHDEPMQTDPMAPKQLPRSPTAMKMSPSKSERVAPLDLDAFDNLDKNHVGADALPEGVTVKTMNRYKNILPNPHSRVRLSQIGDDPTTAYINANYIRSIEGAPNYYIAAQGPTPTCVIPFWRMIWQNEVKIIIMVTGIVEKGKNKCSRYWPDAINSAMKYGDIIVTVKSAKQLTGYKVAELEARKENGSSPPRKITHMWFDSWPDFGVPNSSEGVVDMLQFANELDPAHVTPWIVHCSAGIGRTGTFIGVDAGMRLINKLNAVDTTMLIKHMREDRGGMIQTKDQYEFLHTVLTNYYKEKGTDVGESIYGNTQSPDGENLYANAAIAQRKSVSKKTIEALYKNVGVDKEAEKMYATLDEIRGSKSRQADPNGGYEIFGDFTDTAS